MEKSKMGMMEDVSRDRTGKFRAFCSEYLKDVFREDDGVLYASASGYGSLRYGDSLSCWHLGRLLFAQCDPSVTIREDDGEFMGLLANARFKFAMGEKVLDPRLQVYIVRTVSLAMERPMFAKYRGAIADLLRIAGFRGALKCIRYFDPTRGKGRKPAYTYVNYCVVRHMCGELNKFKRRLLRTIAREEKDGMLANPELYVALGAFTRENWYDIAQDATGGPVDTDTRDAIDEINRLRRIARDIVRRREAV